MPELPDILGYQDAMRSRIMHAKLIQIKLHNPFILRSVADPQSYQNSRVTEVKRLGKRLVLCFDRPGFMVIHLMIAGRFHWLLPTRKPTRTTLVTWFFEAGQLTLTEQGNKRRASLHIYDTWDEVEQHNPGGLDVRLMDEKTFIERLTRENKTLKRALTDPHIFDGIGNAYSDEILHASALSPLKRSRQLNQQEQLRLFEACKNVLAHWIDHLRDEVGDGFPEGVTAFRPEMAVHGRYQKPCPKCQTPVQRIRYAQREANYCPTCQTDGKLLADRALSRLLKGEWPKRWEDLER